MHPFPILYQIYVDGFARGSSNSSPGRRRGGDLEGICERLEHIAALGCDALWLTPIFPTASDHGYNATDFFSVDPLLSPGGSAEAGAETFRALVDTAHRLGIRVLLDLTLNHAGHGLAHAALPRGHSAQIRPARSRQEHSWSRDLKYFDIDHGPTRAFLFDVARYWVEEYGVDGYRFDYILHTPNAFFRDLYGQLATIRKDLYIVGEHWDEHEEIEESIAGIASRFDHEGDRCFDTLFDFAFQAAATSALATGTCERLVTVLERVDAVFPRPGCSMLDNHDVSRITDWVGGDWRRVRNGLRLLASRSGPICLYYGVETNLRSGGPAREGFDLSSRLPMPWGALDREAVEETRAILAARREEPAFASGTPLVRLSRRGLFGELRRSADGRRGLVLLNLVPSEVPVGTDLSALVPGDLSARALCGGDPLEVRSGRLVRPIPEYGGGLYAIEESDAGSRA